MNYILVHIVKSEDGNEYENYMGSIEAKTADKAMVIAISHLEFYSIIDEENDSWVWHPNEGEPILKVSHGSGGVTIYKVVPPSNITPYNG